MNAYNSKDKVITSNEATTAKNKWTVMIYHSGDADLGPEFVWAMKEIARVGVPRGVEVVAVMDSVAPTPYEFNIKHHEESLARDPTARGNRLFGPNGIANELRVPDHDQQTARKESGRNIHEIDFASKDNLSRFISKTVTEHTAEHYLLILSGHGAGIVGDTFLRDQGAGTFMTIPMLDRALRAATEKNIRLSKGARKEQPIDILGFDACCMMTAEVAHSLIEDVSHIVGSEGFMTLDGWPYHEILECLRPNPDIEPAKFAKQIVSRCVNYYSDFARVGTSIDLAACNLKPGGWKKLTDALRKLTRKLMDAIDYEHNEENPPHAANSVIAARWYAQSYGSEQYVDLFDFCMRLADTAPAYKPECQAVADAVKALVVKSCYAGADFQESYGLSLYFPWAATQRELRKYRTNSEKEGREVTEFEAQTGWGSFLEYFIGITRRDPRPQPAEIKIDVPPEGYDSAEEHRTGTIVNIRNGTIVNIRGQVVLPRVKNPALASYEDECLITAPSGAQQT